MDTQYVVEFECTNEADGVEEVFDQLVDHACEWLQRDVPSSEMLLSRATLESAGSIADQRGRLKTWKPIHSSNIQCLLIAIEQPLANSEIAKFVTTLTICGDSGPVRLRLEMGRETEGVMRPATIDELRRPQVLHRLCRDRSLKLRRRGQIIEDRWLPITRDSNRQLLVNIVAELDRLPILIVDGDNVAAPLFGQLVGRELVGLVRVVLVRRFLIPGLNQELANYGAQLPFDGAVLVWPDAKSVLRHPQYTREDIDHGWFKQGNTRLNKLVGSLMRMLAPLSVAASGPNQILASARRAQADDIRAAREEQLRTQIAAATASATNEAKVQRLEELLESLRTENEELWAEYTQQEDRHKAEFARVTKDFALSFAQHRQSPTPQQQQGFELVPDLDDDLTALASYLSTEYDGAIVFTNAAHTSWRESNYPYPEKMREALIALAKAGTAYRDANGRTNGRFSDWMHLNFGVRMSVLDDTLSDLELDVFDFEDATYSRLPHLQLDDHTTRDRVGRVYFAIDDNDLRFIVDHVGLKLYGL